MDRTRTRVVAWMAGLGLLACKGSGGPDRTPPAPPVLQVSPPSPANDNHPVVSGVTEPGARVRIYSGGDCSGAAAAEPVADGAGAFGAPIAVADDTTTTFRATAEDAAGNVSACSEGVVYVEDSAIPILSFTTPIGPANDNLPLLHGATAANRTVYVFGGADCAGPPLASGTADGVGAFAIPVPITDDATVVLRANTSAAGGAAGCSNAVSYTEDSTPPSTAGAVVSDGPSVDIDVTPEATTAAASWTGFADVNGVASYEFALATDAVCATTVLGPDPVGAAVSASRAGLSLADGTYHACVRATDVAGNASGWVASDGVRVDTAAPSVVSTSPARDATGVRAADRVSITFDEAMDCGTLTSASFTLVRNSVPVSGTVACEGAVATFTPAARLAYLATYTATVTTAATDLAGHPLPSAHSWSFMTGVQQWSGPVYLGPGMSPRLAVNAAGVAFVQWDRYGPPRDVDATRYVPGAGWEASTRLDDDTASSGYMDIAVDADGNAMALWAQASSPFSMWARRFDAAGEAWDDAQLVETYSGGNTYRPSVRFDAAGDAIAVWEQVEGTSQSIVANRYVAGTGWIGTQAIDGDTGSSSFPKIAVASDGRAFAAWVHSEASQSFLAVATFDGTVWQPPEALDVGVQPAYSPMLLLDGAGNASAFWNVYDSTASHMDCWWTRWTPGSGWSAPELAESETASASCAAVAMDSAGNVLQLLRAGHLVARWYLAGSGWQPGMALETLAGDINGVAAAVDGFGDGMAVWSQTDGTRYDLYARYFLAGSGWQATQLIESRSVASTRSPVVAFDAHGDATVVWDYNDLQVWANRYE